ncbi:NAD(P)/FAD-dependent oxidoreductase [Vibrio mangrovi]|uniref:NAD(P)/FAD-dependent oxidoreductase n=1 Tax=Vibrio mangrovi TaxID=474394 RepID=A0A1Y6IR30_9VIBR|nr:NAD(P)/FAD-dependent oxidoreductase [Vibrio mangrovi]MDW6001887.1 NAD(P)/FAD-dependent oxidoreductase [Vibrio mangrovi]SMS00086.1 Tryptophan halogenase [Vibrio mangrovi]
MENRDVIIIGGSKAGACLARQLKLSNPELDITIIERKNQFNSWVGESTLESFWDYMNKDLQLGHYLDSKFIYKHGLRFFFDNNDHSLPVNQMSEVGRSWYHSIPAVQIDRQVFDNDMVTFNREIGVEVRMGESVSDLEIDGEQGHTVITSKGTYKCRYLVDASGFSSPLGKKLGLIEPQDIKYSVSSMWGRFKFTNAIDQLGGTSWHERTNFTTRQLSTNHFMYKNYWFWLIPLDEQTVSIGLTSKDSQPDLGIKNQAAFIEFLQSHQCMKEILGDQFEIQDFQLMKRLSRRATVSFSKDRWFLTGMSSGFLDPMISPGSAYLTDANRMIGEIIQADLANDTTTFEGKIKAYNGYLYRWYESFKRHITGNYHGSYEVHRTNINASLIHWYGSILPKSFAKKYGYTESINSMTQEEIYQQIDKEVMMSGIYRVHQLAQEFEDVIKGHEYRLNQGEFFDIVLKEDQMMHSFTRGKYFNMSCEEIIDHDMLRAVYRNFIYSIHDFNNTQLNASEEKLSHAIECAISDQLSLAETMKLLLKEAA